MNRLLRFTALVSLCAWLAAAAVVLLPSSSAPAVAADGEAQSQTKTLTRDYFDASGDPVSATNKVTVNIDRHTNLQNDERIAVTWSGAHPTGGRTVNPYGSGGMNQEYPVLVMECRGNADTVTPQSCWTSTYDQRTISAPQDPATDQAVWLDDVKNTASDKSQISGLTDDQAKNLPSGDCKFDADSAAHITPFVTAAGKVYYSCSNDDMAPEAAQASVTPPNEISAFTDGNGNGSIEFQIRTDLENESLGCSQSVSCSLVVIPIEGISCSSADEKNCNKTGYYDAGEPFDGITDGEMAVSPKLWWSPSNWDNRYVFPLTMAPAPSVCSLSTTAGKPVPFYGSELLSQAALQWTPAYCLNSSRFNWQDNVMPDDAAFTLMQGGQAAAAEVSGRRDGDTGVGYAPTAVSGWGIAFDIDRPDGTQLMSLKLDPRLLAKLLTESYPGSALGAERPGLETNPYSINLDPEFQQLNPGLDVRHAIQAASTVLAISTSSDVMRSLTDYIAADPDAMSFIAGKPDPWGMKINPAYKGIGLPVSTWPLLDSWYPDGAGSDCLKQNPAPYLAKVAAPVSSLRLISQAMLYNWPNANTVCSYDTGTNVYTIGRMPQQGIGNRFMLGLVDLGDAARSGLPVASLEAAPGHYVAPTNASLADAIQLAQPAQPAKVKKTKKGKAAQKAKAAAKAAAALLPESLDQKTVRTSATAYPGTMAVYTAAKTYGLDATTAQNVSQFIKISTTEGQVPGRANGQLPDGYLPITSSGATAELFARAQTVAEVIAKQKAPAAPTAPTASATPTPTGKSSTGTASVAPPPAAAPPPGSAPAPVAVSAPPKVTGSTVTAATAPVVKTAAISSGVGGGLLPLLLLVGLFSGLVTLGGRVWLQLKGAR